MKLGVAFVLAFALGSAESKLLRKSVVNEEQKKQSAVWGGIFGGEQLEIKVNKIIGEFCIDPNNIMFYFYLA